MKRLLLALACFAAPAQTPPDLFKVQFANAGGATAVVVVCERTGPLDMRCVDAQAFLRQRDIDRVIAEEMQRRREAQQEAWTHGENQL